MQDKPLKLADAKIATPAVKTIGRYVEQLRHAVFDGCKEEDVVEIMKGQVAKARKGDSKAAAFVLNYLTGGPAKAEAPAPAPAGGASVGELRAMVCRYLAHHGPTPEDLLAEIFGFAGDEDAILECERFAKSAAGWHLTTLGRKAI